MNHAVLQCLLALAMLLTTAVAGVVSLKVMSLLMKGDGEQTKTSAKWLSFLSCFSGGVFLATCFLDIIPEIAEDYSAFVVLTGKEWTFPVPYFLICCGFFLVYLFEEACIRVFAMGHSHNAVHTEENSANIARRQSYVDDESKHGTLHDQVIEESVQYVMSADEETSFLKSITFAVAMSFHSLLEGFALGVQDSTTGIVTLFVSLILHKAVEAFSVCLQVSKGAANRKKVAFATICVYSLMTPLGSMIGTFLRNSNVNEVAKSGIILFFESLAGGTFIYVTLLEVLAHEKVKEHDSLLQWMCIVIGFSLISLIQFFTSGHAH